MARFKRLTDAEARRLTRRELLDRVEAEQAYWHRKRAKSVEDAAAEREFRRIMHAYISIEGGLQVALDTVNGRRSTYWDERPGEILAGPGLVLDDNQRAGLEYGMRLLARERDTEAGQ